MKRMYGCPGRNRETIRGGGGKGGGRRYGESRRFSTSGFFHESVSPQAPEYSIRAVSNFFVLLIPVVHLDLRISLQIFENIRNGPNRILWGWGDTDS